jgi:hypothetical protein
MIRANCKKTAVAPITMSLCILQFALCTVRADYDLAENQARFIEVTGEVRVVPQGSSNWLDARTDLPIDVGDVIQVGEESQAEIYITKNVLWVLQPNTEVIVGHTTTREGRLSLKTGGMIGKVEAPGTAWAFETPMALCGVRGTEFALTHTSADGTRLGVFKGTVELQPAESAEGTYPSVTIHAHEEGVLQRGKPFQKLARFSPGMDAQARHLPAVQKRFQIISGIWGPLTVEYRKELRRKIVPPVKMSPIRRRAAVHPSKTHP